jgi:hypothetical protein
VGTAISLVLFALAIKDEPREEGDAKPRPQRKWLQNKDFREVCFFDRSA